MSYKGYTIPDFSFEKELIKNLANFAYYCDNEKLVKIIKDLVITGIEKEVEKKLKYIIKATAGCIDEIKFEF